MTNASSARSAAALRQASVVAWAQQLVATPQWVISETTGLSASAEIVEIAIIDAQGTVLLDSLVKPTRGPIPAEATRIHGITETMVAEAPSFAEVYPRIADILATHSYQVVAYNVSFDLLMLRNAVQRHQLPLLPELHGHCVMRQYAIHYGQAGRRFSAYRWRPLGTACVAWASRYRRPTVPSAMLRQR